MIVNERRIARALSNIDPPPDKLKIIKKDYSTKLYSFERSESTSKRLQGVSLGTNGGITARMEKLTQIRKTYQITKSSSQCAAEIPNKRPDQHAGPVS
jgi:hypothetical protein